MGRAIGGAQSASESMVGRPYPRGGALVLGQLLRGGTPTPVLSVGVFAEMLSYI